MSANILPLHVILFSRAPIDQRYHEVFGHACGLDAYCRVDVIFAETPEEVFAKITAEAFDGVFLPASLLKQDMIAVIDFCSGHFRLLPLFGLAELEDEKDRLARDYPALRSVLSVDAFLSREFRSLFMSYIADKNIIMSLAAQQENLLSLIQHSVNGMLVLDKQNSILFLNIAAMSLLEKSFPNPAGAKVNFPLICGRPVEHELRNMDGSFSTLQISVAEMIWSGAPAFFVGLEDVSARKALEKKVTERTSIIAQMNQELQESVQKFEMVMSTADVAVWDWKVSEGTIEFSRK